MHDYDIAAPAPLCRVLAFAPEFGRNRGGSEYVFPISLSVYFGDIGSFGAEHGAAHSPLPGILCLCTGATIFSLQDVVIKLMSGSYPLSEVLAMRGLIACVPLAFLLHFGAIGLRALKSERLGLLLLRSALLLCSYTTYYLALANLPLAVGVALFFTAPLFIVILSGPLLGEKVSPAQFVAVAVGFIGVLVICFGPYFSAARDPASRSPPCSTPPFWWRWLPLVLWPWCLDGAPARRDRKRRGHGELPEYRLPDRRRGDRLCHQSRAGF